MPALRDLQAAFAAHIVGADRPDLAATVASNAITAEARLRIYRHHVFHSLASALGATFSTVQALVGEEFFRAMARAFVARELPSQPVLAEYGAGFADFVASYPSAAQLPYLFDVARLDWALNVAFHSPVGVRLGAAELSAIPTERLPTLRVALAPGTELVRSHYPIDRIWSASQPGTGDETVDLDAGGVRLAVMQRADDAGFAVLGEGEATLMEALRQGTTLEAAATAGLAAEVGFDVSVAFGRLLGLGVFAAPQQ